MKLVVNTFDPFMFDFIDFENPYGSGSESKSGRCTICVRSESEVGVGGRQTSANAYDSRYNAKGSRENEL